MRALNRDENEVYTYLGCEQADKVDKGEVGKSKEGDGEEDGKS